MMTTLGKYRHLSRCSGPTGVFIILAIDHRQNLLQSLNEHAPAPLDPAAFTAFKQEVLETLIHFTTGVLTDPAHGIGPGIANKIINGWHGLIAPLEITNYDLHPSQREVNFIPAWSIAKIKRIGGDGVKLLLPYHPEDDSAFDKQDIVAHIVEECRLHDIPLFLEPITYSLDPETPLSNEKRREISVEMARVFSQLGVDVLKLEFPVDASQSTDEEEWRAACADLNAACTVPWALLSAGVDYPTFARQTRIACEAGASGVIVGRAVWAEAVKLQGEAREAFIKDTASHRMHELLQLVESTASSWQERLTLPEIAPDWYELYEQ